MSKPKIISQAQEKQTPAGTDLPPAGHARNEEMAKRTDQLAEAAETAPVEMEAIDPSRFRLDREIAREHNNLRVSGEPLDGNGDPIYRYYWAYAPQHQSGNWRDVDAMLQKRVWDTKAQTLVPTWELCKGRDYPEALENVDVLGCRRIGDVVLMRCRRDKYAALEAYRDMVNRERLGQVSTPEVDEQARRLGVRPIGAVLDDPNGEIGPAEMRRHLLATRYGDDIKRGTIPGAPAPGVGR